MMICNLKEMSCGRVKILLVLIVALMFTACTTAQEATQHQEGESHTVAAAGPPPQTIPENVSCGKCGMFPAKFPKWQSQVIFKDGSMIPFDGCKCMFGFLLDPNQKTADVAVVWVKDFNSGEWINGKDVYFVVGSGMMGPMGKELIPFSDHMAAMDFQKKHGGGLEMYGKISMATLEPLMGGIGGMKMGGHGSM